jgi:Zn-dependent protease
MFRSFRLGRAFGIPLFLHPTFFLLPLYALFVSRDQGPAGMLLTQLVLLTVFACVLLHELGHALMARAFNIPTRDITLYPIGGVARLESTGGRPHQEIAIALAGPAVNLVIAVLLIPFVALCAAAGLFGKSPDPLAAAGGSLDGFVAHYLLLICIGNLGLLVFNLIPAFPMDGGRVLRAVLALAMSRLRATEIAAGLGLLAALALAVVGVVLPSPSLVVVSLFVGFAGQAELFALRQRTARRPERVVEPLDPIILPPRPGGFTGLAWDQERGVWVRWIDGVPQQ